MNAEEGDRVHRRRRRKRGLRRGRPVVIAVLIGVVLLTFAGVTMLRATPDAKGQVVAVVNGAEITQQDVEAEARSTAGSAAPPSEDALLETVVSRVLLQQEAKARGLDRSPTYPSELHRALSQALADQLIRQITMLSLPDLAHARAYERVHSAFFGDRLRYVLKELRFRSREVPPTSATSFEDIRDWAQKRSLGLDISSQTIASDSLPPTIDAVLRNLPIGQTLALRTGDANFIVQLLDRTPAPLVGEAADAAATAAIFRDSKGETLGRTLQTLRRSARIRYQKGYGPAI